MCTVNCTFLQWEALQWSSIQIFSDRQLISIIILVKKTFQYVYTFMLYTCISYVVQLLGSSLFDQIKLFLEENAVYLSALEKDYIFPLKNVCFRKIWTSVNLLFYIFSLLNE